MGYEFYKILHVFSAFVLFTSLGTLAASLHNDSGMNGNACQGHGSHIHNCGVVTHGIFSVG